MPTTIQRVAASAPAPGLDARRAWDLLADGDLPRLCDQVLEVTPEGDGQRWRVLLNGSEVRWRQVERARTAERLEFEQTEGDLAVFAGTWALRDGRLSLELLFHLGVDGLAPLLDPIWGQSLKAFADALVHAVATHNREHA